MNLEEKLYTSTEVAKILGVSLRSVYRYLEQDKLDAEIKTATGRLRFTRQNILDFLYPEGEEESIGGTSEESRAQKEAVIEQVSQNVTGDFEEEKAPAPEAPEKTTEAPVQATEQKPKVQETVKDDTTESVQEESAKEEEEEVDWLSKFKAAAAQHETPAKTEEQRKEEKESIGGLSSLSAEEEVEEVDEEPYKYYKSMLGGLKEVAQNIDKVSRKSGVNYAFTLYAGLSLEKPLKNPFSVLHSYVDKDAEELFKKMLQLEKTNEQNAQLCLITTDEPEVFANKVEKHGLFVVGDEQLVEDFKEMGLEEELNNLL